MTSIDLEKIQFEKSTEIETEGWVPLKIEYAVRAFSGISWLFWKVSGTDHVFQIQYQIILLNHAGILKDHLELALKTFRTDYKSWEKTNFQEDWMKNYQRMFQNFII
jgi:hypothetical protein